MRHIFRLIMVAGVCITLLAGLGGTFSTTEARGATWTVYFYDNPDLFGAPIGTYVTSGINYNWGAGPPTFAAGLPADGFSIRFTTSVFFTAGNYQFTAQVNDAVRLYIDGAILINQWPGGDVLQTVQNNYLFATDAIHSVTVEMRETVGDAAILVSWALNPGGGGGGGICTEGFISTYCPYGSVAGTNPAPIGWPPSSGPTAICADGWNSCSTTAAGTCAAHGGVRDWCLGGIGGGGGGTWYGEFYNNIDWSGAPVYTGLYGTGGLQANWGTGSPNAAVYADSFTARFTRTINVPNDLPEGTYLFFMSADDHFRLLVDGYTLMDKTGAPANDYIYALDIPLLPGNHTLVFEYREISATAHLLLTWDPPSAQNPVTGIPSSPPILLPEWMQAAIGSGTIITTGSGVPIGGVTATPKIAALNFRSGPSLTDSIITKISSGNIYAVTGRTADSRWAQLIVNNAPGWAYASYLTFTGDFASVPVTFVEEAPPEPVTFVPSPTGIKGTTQANLRIREDATTRSKQIGLIPIASSVDLLGKNAAGTWYMVSYQGTVGWSSAYWIAIYEGEKINLPVVDVTGSVMANPPASATTPVEGVVLRALGNMRVRTGPDFKYPQIARIPWGEEVKLIARSADGRWYKVQYGETVGWSYSIWFKAVEGDPRSVPISDL